MPTKGPILILEKDHDDQALLKDIFQQLDVPNKLRFFEDGHEALNYLRW